MNVCRLAASTLLLTSLGSPAWAQQKPAVPPAPPPLVGSIESHKDWPAPRDPADVDTIDHIMAAIYDVISGPAGQQRDWDRFRSLFLPDGRLGPMRLAAPATADRPAHKTDILFLTPEDYAKRNDPYFKTHGFFEHSIANRVEEFGNLVSVWSSYESRHTAADATPFARGINSLNLIHAQGRYWIVSILWDEERPGLTLPDKYLK